MGGRSSSWTARSAIGRQGQWDHWPPCSPGISPMFTSDRRGRGDSGNTAPYAIDREVEDIDVLIKEAGGSACLFGMSSGAALALEAANRGLAIRKLAVYEAPFIVDASRPPIPDDFLTRLNGLVASDRRADAVRLFMKLVGVLEGTIEIACGETECRDH